MPQFIFNVAGLCHSVSDFLAQEHPITLAKPMKRLLHRVLCHAQFGGDISLCWLPAFADEEFLQLVEQRRVVHGSGTQTPIE